MDKKREKTIAERILKRVRTRLDKIEFNQEKYSCDIVQFRDSLQVQVKYDKLTFLRLEPFISRVTIGKRKAITGMFRIYAIDDMSWYQNLLTNIDIDVNENLMCLNNTITLDSILEERLPLGNDNEKKVIEDLFHKHNLDYSKILFDTVNLRYVIQITSKIELGEPKVGNNNQVYKYTTLATFKKILEHGTYRLNSIVSMNDTSEAFFLGDYLCDAYNDIIRSKFDDCNYLDRKGLRYNKLLEYKKYLIGSFTTKYDDPLMWERYGDKYQGVCIAFEYNPSIMKPITYCGKDGDYFAKLKNVAEELQKKGIHIYYDLIGEKQLYVKHWQFEGESELRLLKKYDKEDIEFDLYGNLITYYHDYQFDELGLKPVGLLVGAMLPNQDVNFPLLCELAINKLGIKEILISKCNKFRF